MSGDYETHKNQQPHVSYAGKKVDLDKYALFVDGVTSNPSKNYQSFLESLSTLDGEGSNTVSYTHLTLPTRLMV